MTTAANLRDALLALAKPTPKQLPPALAGVFPPGCFLRARTAGEEVALHGMFDAYDPPANASAYEKGHYAIVAALSYSLCDADGNLITPGDVTPFQNLPAWSTTLIQDELTIIAKNEQAEQGKD